MSAYNSLVYITHQKTSPWGPRLSWTLDWTVTLRHHYVWSLSPWVSTNMILSLICSIPPIFKNITITVHKAEIYTICMTNYFRSKSRARNVWKHIIGWSLSEVSQRFHSSAYSGWIWSSGPRISHLSSEIPSLGQISTGLCSRSLTRDILQANPIHILPQPGSLYWYHLWEYHHATRFLSFRRRPWWIVPI